MHLRSHPFPSFGEEHSELYDALKKIYLRFPKTFDERLIKGFERLIANSAKKFIYTRDQPYLLRLLVIQFFLQKKIESAIDAHKPRCVVQFFREKSHLCLLTCIPFEEEEQVLDKDCLLKILQTLMPGVAEIAGSFWRWLHPELPFMCLYLEMHRLRGKEVLPQEIRSLKHFFEERLTLFSSTRSPSVFWPFNVEETYKQLLILQNELHSCDDIPQVAIHFRQQTGDTLEFLITVALAQTSFAIDQHVAALAPSINFFLHFSQAVATPFPKTMLCFSLFLPVHQFKEHNTINLLQARDRVVQCLVSLLGPLRDYNGGLFETQRSAFEDISRILSDKVPFFSIFAEKVFHGLQPVESRFFLSLEEIEELLLSIAWLIQNPTLNAYTSSSGHVWILKTKHQTDSRALAKNALESRLICAEFNLLSFHYFCLLDNTKKHIENFQNKSLELSCTKEHTTLRLAFLEGCPPSLSPYLALSDTRCRAISKLLFEGLTRIDASGLAQPAAAKEIEVSHGGKQYTFSLCSSHWSNGRPLTAVDYLNGWKNVLNRRWASNHPELLFIIKNGKNMYKRLCPEQDLGVYVKNPSTLQVELEYADPHFLEKLAQPIFFPAFGISQEPNCFNGPYLVHHYNQNRLELEINPYFWDAKNTFFQYVHIRWDLNTKDAFEAFRRKEIDWIGDPFTQLSTEILENLEKEGKLYKKSTVRPFFVYLNTQHPLLCSPLIRQALSLSLNRTFICKHIFPYQDPLYNPLPLADECLISENVQYARELFDRGLSALNLEKNRFHP